MHRSTVSRFVCGALALSLCATVANAEADRAPIEGGEAPPSATAPAVPEKFDQGVLFPYSYLDYALLYNVDRDGNVNYAGLKGDKNLAIFLKAVATADLSQFPKDKVYEVNPETGRESKVREIPTYELIFWINSYNAHLLNAIAQAYPIKSIDDIKGFDTEKKYIVAGKAYSFAEMREKVQSFGDPRALFALATGTRGGFLPSPTAVRYVEFDARMNSAVSVFLDDPRNIQIKRIENKVVVNDTLKSIDTAFAKSSSRRKHEGIRKVLAGYGNARGYFGAGDFTIEFKEADRVVNDKTSRGLNS